MKQKTCDFFASEMNSSRRIYARTVLMFFYLKAVDDAFHFHRSSMTFLTFDNKCLTFKSLLISKYIKTIAADTISNYSLLYTLHKRNVNAASFEIFSTDHFSTDSDWPIAVCILTFQ